MTRPRLIVHGGAGSHEIDQPQDILEEAAEQGYEELVENSPIDAVETAVNRLEDHPAFNAGHGGKYQLDGKPRLEAAIMQSDGSCGSVTDLEQIEHAISVARAIMEETHHVMLSGPPATQFALEHGFEGTDLRTEKAHDEWKGVQETIDGLSWQEQIDRLKAMDTSGTVGCVAVDADGRLAAGTSTGGRSPQLAGRVGDTPMIGAGTYCNTDAAVSATGVGEAIIQMTLARRCVKGLERGQAVQTAAETAIQDLADETGRHAGVIMLDADGATGVSHNAEEMNTVIRD